MGIERYSMRRMYVISLIYAEEKAGTSDTRHLTYQMKKRIILNCPIFNACDSDAYSILSAFQEKISGTRTILSTLIASVFYRVV